MTKDTARLKFKNFFLQNGLPETLLLGLASIVIGILAGGVVWLFKRCIELFQILFFDGLGNALSPLGKWTVLFFPALGGLIVGWMVYRWIGRERYHGLPGIIEASAFAGGRLPYHKLPARVLAAAISIGSGASVGPEDPSVQIGANIGSLIAQRFRFSEDRVRAMVAGGAAAGIAAAFNAPIAGVFFALEVLLGELSSSSFGFAAVSAFSSAVLTQAISGTYPAFIIPPYGFGSVWELPLYLVMGLLAGGLAALYIKLIAFSRQKFAALNIPAWLKPALAGLGVGLVGVFLPQVFGVGYDSIEHVLSGQSLSLLLLLTLLIAKLILTPLSVGGGFVGGVFAPALFLGAMLGGFFGTATGYLFPGLDILPPSFALVGMAAVLAGTVHAPLTAILLLFEMTHDYRIILPLMFAVAVSLTVSRLLQRESVYTLPLAKNGIRLEKGRDVDVLDGISVQEVMDHDITAVKLTDSMNAAAELLAATRHHALPVLDNQGSLTGILALQDLASAQETGRSLETIAVAEYCTRNVIKVTADETIGKALRQMSSADVSRLPVVSREEPGRLLGILRRSDALRAYELGLIRRASLRHRIQEIRVGALGGVEVQDIRIPTGSPVADKKICEIAWPREIVISSIRRGTQVLLPHGDTLLKSGDVLIITSERDGLAKVKQLIQ